MPTKFLPNVPWTTPATPVAPRDTLNGSARDPIDIQSNLAAENAPLRVLYGRVRLGALIANVLRVGSGLVILAVWGHGEISSVVDFTIDDKAPASGVLATHHMGTSNQAVDATLVSAFAQQSPAITFTDTMPGVAYSVITVPDGASAGFPRIAAVIDGLKVWTGAARVWSDNPAYCLADFVTSTVYGCGRNVDWTNVASVAVDCDALVGTAPYQEKTRTLNLVLDTVQQVKSWVETLRTYAGCWVVPNGTALKLVSDKPDVSVMTFDHAAGTIQKLQGLKKRGVQSMPTVMTVNYTDTTSIPWKQGTATAYARGVLDGTTPRRESSVSLPGVTRYSQAYREAVERLNKLLLNDLSCDLQVFDEALSIEFGDIVTVTDPIGLSAKQLRVMNVGGEYGRYTFGLVEYDPAVYCPVVTTTPTYADTALPNPSAPPAVTGVAMLEEVFQLQNGIWSSRFRVTWSAATYPFLDHYRCELWAGSTLMQTTRVSTPEWATAAVKESVAYTVKVAAVSSIAAVGTYATQTGTAEGKYLVPSDVPQVSAFEAGGRVYISWQPATDIDIWKYEVRYGAVGVGWAAATILDRIQALRLTSDQIAVGTWSIYVKAIDSVNQYSTNAATCTVTVTSDSTSFLVNTLNSTAPALTNMVEYALARSDATRYFVSDDGVAFGTKYSAALGTYTNALASYHASMTSTWLGESKDFGMLLGGQWTINGSVADVSGSHTTSLGTSTDGATWAYTAGASQKLNSRFARIKHEALGTATLQVQIPTQSIRIDAIPRSETGSDTSSASFGKTQYLTNDFLLSKSITVAPQGSAATNWTYDNVGRNNLNAADMSPGITLVGNTMTRDAATFWYSVRGRHPLPSKGKWYFEVLGVAGGNPANMMVGLTTRTIPLQDNFGYPGSFSYYGGSGNLYSGGAASTYGSTWGAGDVIGVAYDADLAQLRFYKNNVAQPLIVSVTGERFLCLCAYSGVSMTLRLLASEFSYSPPTGYTQLPYAFDVFLFNGAGAKVAQPFLWNFQGV